jgi:hypothetical protein
LTNFVRADFKLAERSRGLAQNKLISKMLPLTVIPAGIAGMTILELAEASF